MYISYLTLQNVSIDYNYLLQIAQSIIEEGEIDKLSPTTASHQTWRTSYPYNTSNILDELGQFYNPSCCNHVKLKHLYFVLGAAFFPNMGPRFMSVNIKTPPYVRLRRIPMFLIRYTFDSNPTSLNLVWFLTSRLISSTFDSFSI